VRGERDEVSRRRRRRRRKRELEGEELVRWALT